MVFSWLRRWLNPQSRTSKRAGRKWHRPYRLALRLEQFEDRTLLSTLDITGGVLNYAPSAGDADNLTISVSGGQYTFTDNGQNGGFAPIAITLSGAGTALWSGDGTSSVSGPVATVSTIDVLLSGNGGNDTLVADSFSGLTSGVTLDGGVGGAGGNLLQVPFTDANMTLTDTSLKLSNFAPTISLSNFQSANLQTGAAGNKNFTVSGWTGQATLDGSLGLTPDSLVAVDNANFLLTDSGLTVTPGGTFTLSNINRATLTGGPGSNNFDVGGWSGTATLNGGAGVGADSLTLASAATTNTWNITSSNAGTVNRLSNGNLTFSLIANLTGGSGNDRFKFSNGVGFGVTGNIDGGTGVFDTLDYSLFVPAVTVNLGTSTAPDIGGTFTSINSLVGGTASDSLVGGNGGNAWSITGSNAGSVAGVNFSSFENLIAGTGGDTFSFLGTATLSGGVRGGPGADELDFSGTSTARSIQLTGSGPSGFNGTVNGIAGGFTNIDSVVGSSSSDTLIGTNSDATWDVGTSGNNTGDVNGVFGFSSIENLTGGTGNDTFVFSAGTGVAGKIDGGGGINALDYSAYTTSATVNLATGAATNVNGGLPNSIPNIINVTGGAANDTITGNGLNNLLIGNGGNDSVKDIKQKHFVQQLTQRYAYWAARGRLEEQGFTLATEEKQKDGRIHLVLRRMG